MAKRTIPSTAAETDFEKNWPVDSMGTSISDAPKREVDQHLAVLDAMDVCHDILGMLQGLNSYLVRKEGPAHDITDQLLEATRALVECIGGVTGDERMQARQELAQQMNLYMSLLGRTDPEGLTQTHAAWARVVELTAFLAEAK